jgi:hypothetical protein
VPVSDVVVHVVLGEVEHVLGQHLRLPGVPQAQLRRQVQYLEDNRYLHETWSGTNGGHRTDVVMWEVRKRMRHVLIKNIFRIFLFKGALGIKKILTVPTLVLLFRNDLFRIWMRPFNKLEL